MQQGSVFEMQIDGLAAGGAGVGRGPDGRAVFVPGTAPGDRVRVAVETLHRRHAWGRLEAVLEPGASRVEPPCPVFGSCGGCSWQHVAYPAQLEAKAAILHNALKRIGGLGELPVPRVVPSPAGYGHRRRARLWVEEGRVGFRQRRSHRLCPTSRCPVLVPALEEALAKLETAPPEAGEWELLAGEEGVRCAKVGSRDAEAVHVRVGHDRLRVSAGVFVQSSAPLLEPLVEAVHEAAGRGGVALELYAGAGFLTLGLARRFERVFAVESRRAAVRDLRHNCAAAGLANVTLRPMRVEHALGAGRLPEAADVAVLDAPRSGLPRGAAAALARLRPRRLVVLSCDPATLARDLAALGREGYALEGVEGFDLFPQTPHLEALARLELRTPSGAGSGGP